MKGDENHIKVCGEVAYTPSHPSGANADVKITGRVQVSSVTELPSVPEGAKGAICFIRGRPQVYAASGWSTLPTSFAAGRWVDADAYYTVFTSESLDGTFRAESDSVRFDAATTTYTLTVKADTPSKFARVVISDQAFAQGAELQ